MKRLLATVSAALLFSLVVSSSTHAGQSAGRLPESPESGISAKQSGSKLPVETEDWADDGFLEVEQAFRLLPRLENKRLILQWTIAEGYYLYKHQFKFQLELDGVMSEVELTLPSGEVKHDEFFGEAEVYYHELSATASLPDGQPVRFSVRSQGCADAGLCYPPLLQHFQFNAASSGFEEVPGGFANTDRLTGKPASTSGLPSSGTAGDVPADTSLLLVMLFAFLGGAILNLMPCVFPVLALKILALVNASAISSAERRNHGISYAAGVVSSFIAMAALLLGLRSAGEVLGWGFQLQSPWVVAALVYLFFLLGQGMSGYVEFTPSWVGAGQSLTARGGRTGSFFTGMLAVVVASPCTAPFMGAALGFALVQPSVVALSVFAALGLGMAAPFLLLVTVPRLARVLPKPGAWMLTFKEVMAFPLFITAVWLLWVVGRQTGVNGMTMVAAGCVLIVFAQWLWRRPTVQGRASSLVVAASALALLFGPWMERPAGASNDANVYTSERVSALRAGGSSVFVNLTADWCLTCLANKRVALSRTAVLQAFSANNIAYLEGDWTNSDPRITEILHQYGRSGVPLYLLYPADASRPAMVLPQILTPGNILDSIAAL